MTPTIPLTRWFQIGIDGVPHRSGDYEFELWLTDCTVLNLRASFKKGSNVVVTDDGRSIGLVYEDHWRGVMK